MTLENKLLKKEVIKTLLFFNLHNRPLHLKEIHQFLGLKISEAQLFLILMKLVREKTILEKNQLFVLKKYSSLFKTYPQRQKILQKLTQKAYRFSWVFKITPFVRGVFLANSLVLGLPSEKSDIDIVVLTKSGRLWTTRAILNLWFLILGQKRRKGKNSDPQKFCLSYFVDLKKSNLKFLKLKKDPLLIYWLSTLKPLAGKAACYHFQQQNSWVKKHLPNLGLPKKKGKIKPLSFFMFLTEKTLNLFGNWLERKLYLWQKEKIKAKNQKDTNFASLFLYKIHPEGGRKKIAQQFKKELEQY